jgi:hypothetical protein
MAHEVHQPLSPQHHLCEINGRASRRPSNNFTTPTRLFDLLDQGEVVQEMDDPHHGHRH